jgi:hypothetical protein
MTLGLLVGVLILTSPGEGRGSVVSPRQEVAAAWRHFLHDYVMRSTHAMCLSLTPTARRDLEIQVSRNDCPSAAHQWFLGPQYDRKAALRARLVGIYVSGRWANVLDTDPNDPAVSWTEKRGRWQLAAFFSLG